MRINRKLLLTITVILTLLGFSPVFAQQKITVNGKISSLNENTAVNAVTVNEKGTNNSTQANSAGEYSIVVSRDATLVFSSVGFIATELSVAGRETIDVVLKQQLGDLNEVVVIGYGTVKKSDVTGAVSSVSAEQITQVKGISSVGHALQGQAAGVQVIQASGQPGERVSIKIRGTNSIQASNQPLYVVDGLPLDGLSSQLNPSDIENIEVLKDASSTAIYGSRGANGVIMITTKKGKEGKAKVSYNGYYGVQSLRKKINLVNAQEFAILQNEVAANDGTAMKWTQSQIDSLAGKGTDWQDLVYRNAPMQNHDVSVSGGNAGTKYYLSMGYFDQDGIIENSKFKRYSFRTNLDQKITDKLSGNVSLSLQNSNYNQNNYFNADGGGGVPFTTMVMPPSIGVYDANGKYSVFSGVPWGQTNPYALSREEYRPQTTMRIIGNARLTYAIVEGLKLNISAGIDNDWNKMDYYAPGTVSLFPGGGAYKNYWNSNTFVNENFLNYTKSFGKNLIDVVAGLTYQKFNREYLNSGTATGFLTDIYLNNNLNAGKVKGQPANGDPASNYESTLMSYLGRINYTFNEKYIVTLTGRYDGSSKFSETSKYAFFPSGAFGWKISEEPFMSNINAITNLKLRTSYGIAGNQAITPYQTLGELRNDNVIIDNIPVTGYYLNRLQNNNLKWETTAQFDIGFDIGLLNERIQFTADYYRKRTKDLLLNVTMPPSTGFTNVLQNVGEVSNNGFEFLLNAAVLSGKDFTWNTTLTYTSNRTKLIDLGKDALGNPITYKEVGTGGNWFPMIIGQPMQQLYGYKVTGIYQSDAEAVANGEPDKRAGNYIFQNTDGQGLVDGNDRIILSNFQPTFTYGFNNQFGYRNINLSILLVGSVGNDIVNEFRKYNITVNGNWAPTKEAFDNRWVPGKTSGMAIDKPSANSGSDIRDYANSLWVEDGSYMRLRDITLSYDFPSSFAKRLKISGLQVYVSGQNLVTITNYSGYDPEAAWQAATINGWDRGNYPSTKSVTGGVKLNF